jgi:hypothetical protein
VSGSQVQAQALVELEPGGTLMPGKGTRLFHGGVSHQLKRRMPRHAMHATGGL